MSIAGKKSVHFTKKDLQDQKVTAIGFKKIQFAQDPTVGDTEINLSSLTLPSSGIPASFVNPSAADLAAAKLLFNEKNLTLISATKGLLSFDDYTIKNNTTILLKDAVSDASEIFMGIIDPIAKTGLQVVDVDPINTTGTLAISADEFIVGKPFDLNKYPTTQQGAILVFLDGQLMARNVGNQQSAAGDGDYYEVDPGNTQVGNSIKFNVTSGSVRSVMVVSNGLAFAAPSDSSIAQIESQGGQIDAMVPTLAALAGVPESDFQAAPNSTDLAAFGTRMTDAEADIGLLSESGNASNGPLQATGIVAGAAELPTSMIRANTGNAAHGSTNTLIRRFDNFVTTGSDITGVDSATLGTSFTINADGVYAMSYTDACNIDTVGFGISLNAALLSSSINASPPAERLCTSTVGQGQTNKIALTCAVTMRLNAGDVIRPHATDTASAYETTSVVLFTITQIVKL